MADLAQGNVGPEAKYSIKFEGGKLIAEAMYDGAQFDAGIVLKLDADAVVSALIDRVEKMIPDDQTALAALLKGAVKVAV